MALHFNLESPTACERDNSVYAVPHALKGWNSVGQLEPLHIGRELPDMEDLPGLLCAVVQGLEDRGTSRRVQQGLMAIDVVNLCDLDHSDKPKLSRRGPHRLERVGAVVLAKEGAEPFGVHEVRRAGEPAMLELDPPVPGTGPVRPATWLEATPEERDTRPVSQAIQSVPFGDKHTIGYVGLRGFEHVFQP